MKRHDFYMKIVFNLMVLCIFIGFSIILFCNNFTVGFYIESLALLILSIAVDWDKVILKEVDEDD